MTALDAAPSSPTHAPARALIDAQTAMLSRLAEVGMEVAEAVGQAAKAAAGSGDGAAVREAAHAFAKVSRAVRMTIALQSRLMKDLAALDRAEAMAERARAVRRRMRLSETLEHAAEAAVAAQRAAGRRFSDEEAVEDEIERLAEEAYERLVDAEDDGPDGRAFEDVVAGVCKDLGLTPDWTARLMAATGGGDGGGTPHPPATRAPPSPTGGEGLDRLPPCGGGGDPGEAWGGEGSRRPVGLDRAPP